MNFNNRILIVDDNTSIHEDFKKILCSATTDLDAELDDLESDLFGDDNENNQKNQLREYIVDSAFQGQEALEKVRDADASNQPYALIFMDVRMPPGWDGIETICRIWMEFPFIEMVICTAYSDYSWDEITHKLGATDKLLFLTKPFDFIEVKQMALTLIKKWNLGQQARGYVANLEHDVKERTLQLEDILAELEDKNQQLQLTNKELEKAALYDNLTELPNRALFKDRLIQNIKIANRDNHTFAVLLLDVDSFKQINDTHGHYAGDTVLQVIGQRLFDVLRNSDTIARLGGDEFAIILHAVSSDVAIKVAEKALKAIEPPIIINSPNVSIMTGVSIGIAIYPEHGEDQDTLLKNADMAMYDAKFSGAGYSLFSALEESERTNRLKLVNDLSDAINNDNDDLCLFYQPVIDFYTKRVCGVEALSRWRHPTYGNIPPDQFIPLAEQKGLIQPLTIRVLKTAIAQCAQWNRQGINIAVSVNLSTRNFLDPLIATTLKQLLNDYNVNPSSIKLEITESMTITDPDKALGIIEGLKAIGIEMSIDDFGTGYSSLAYLKKLPVDELKIDRMFVDDMNNDKDTRAIVQSTIELAHILGLYVVAEGVETLEVLNLLRDMGCDKAQGYYMCKPLPTNEVTDWLLASEWKVQKSA